MLTYSRLYSGEINYLIPADFVGLPTYKEMDCLSLSFWGGGEFILTYQQNINQKSRKTHIILIMSVAQSCPWHPLTAVFGIDHVGEEVEDTDSVVRHLLYT